jgi:hypothetical protein
MKTQFPNYDQHARNGLENESVNYPTVKCDFCEGDTNEVWYHSDLDINLCEECADQYKVDRIREGEK